MLKKTITYEDFDGNKRTEDFYFNLTKAELMEMELGVSGGVTKLLEKIVAEQDHVKLIEHFKTFIIKAYGEKSLDGRKFMKSQEITDNFVQTNAYSELFMELSTNPKAAADFVNGIIPQEVTDQAAQMPNVSSEPPIKG